MKAWMIVIVLVVIGIVGAWLGYWIGHALGWSTNADFPFSIGGGAGAITLSILVSFGSVMAGTGWLIARPLYRMRQLAARGVPSHATVRRAWRTGVYAAARGDEPRHQVAFEVEVHAGAGRDYVAKATGLLTDAEEQLLIPGAEALVRYDPAHPSSVVVLGPVPA